MAFLLRGKARSSLIEISLFNEVENGEEVLMSALIFSLGESYMTEIKFFNKKFSGDSIKIKIKKMQKPMNFSLLSFSFSPLYFCIDLENL